MFVVLAASALAQEASETLIDRKPNILFIAMDDLNDWIGCMGGHPQARTPNLDRLAKSGVLFVNAHCAGASCNPSRTAIFTGIAPNRSGVYSNRQPMREVLPDAEILPAILRRHGYRSSGSGKMLHYFIDARSWDEYFPKAEAEDPFPRTLYPEERPVSIPHEPWMYIETDWGGLDATDEEFGGDYLVAKWVSDQLAKPVGDKPFFLACGIYRPHEPWFVPQKYFDMFPLEEIQLPPGYKEDDLDDLPPEGKRRGPNRYLAHIRKHEQWKQAIQGYLASIAFADTQLGRVLDALEKSPYRDNTIVVLWSDHGWHLGEKQHWQKFTGWRVCSRVPLMIRVPKGVPGLPAGTEQGICDQPVDLLSLSPTLLELAGLPAHEGNDGPSLVPLLCDSEADWPHVAITYLERPGSFGLSARHHRYIRYPEGGEELYDTRKDPYEWNNLADDPAHKSVLDSLRAKAPTEFARFVQPSVESAPRLDWHVLEAGETPPVSRPQGNSFPVYFINRTNEPLVLWWVAPNGSLKSYGTLEPKQRRKQSSRSGAVWALGTDVGGPKGWFRIADRTVRAIVPGTGK